MLRLDQIAKMREAADTPSDNVHVEDVRGMLGQALDALAVASEQEAMRGGWMARQRVLELHKDRKR